MQVIRLGCDKKNQGIQNGYGWYNSGFHSRTTNSVTHVSVSKSNLSWTPWFMSNSNLNQTNFSKLSLLCFYRCKSNYWWGQLKMQCMQLIRNRRELDILNPNNLYIFPNINRFYKTVVIYPRRIHSLRAFFLIERQRTLCKVCCSMSPFLSTYLDH